MARRHPKARRVIAKIKPPVDALKTLGGILAEDEMDNRDAVHIAVLPVTAQNDLFPGQHVGITDAEHLWVDTGAEKLIGIIDPFLPREVRRGEACYMFLYPRSITSLRHHWSHPDVPEVEQVVANIENEKSVASAVVELQHYCENGGYDTPSYELLIESARNSVEYGHGDDYLTISGEDASGNIPPEVIENLKIVLSEQGLDCSRWNPTYFSCSC